MLASRSASPGASPASHSSIFASVSAVRTRSSRESAEREERHEREQHAVGDRGGELRAPVPEERRDGDHRRRDETPHTADTIILELDRVTIVQTESRPVGSHSARSPGRTFSVSHRGEPTRARVGTTMSESAVDRRAARARPRVDGAGCSRSARRSSPSVVVVAFLHVAGVDVGGWFSDLWDQIKDLPVQDDRRGRRTPVRSDRPRRPLVLRDPHAPPTPARCGSRRS